MHLERRNNWAASLGTKETERCLCSQRNARSQTPLPPPAHKLDSKLLWSTLNLSATDKILNYNSSMVLQQNSCLCLSSELDGKLSCSLLGQKDKGKNISSEKKETGIFIIYCLKYVRLLSWNQDSMCVMILNVIHFIIKFEFQIKQESRSISLST